MSITLEGSNLGAKHKHLNGLASASKETYNFDQVYPEDGDVVNLIKIDIANRNKDIDYILKVLVCEDLLYVSRAIRQCAWLITDTKYKHIINPQYLCHTLYPKMMSKSVAKLNKSIILNLKDSQRVEEFYKYEDDPKKAVEWLPHCSVDFINSNVINHIDHLDLTLVKRLCEKSITVLEVLNTNKNYNSMHNALPATMFLLKHDMDKYLNIVEKQPPYSIPKFNKKATELLMKQASDRIIKKFTDYCNHIHIQTFLKYFKKENIKDFLINLFKEKDINIRSMRCNFDVLTTLISSMPDNDRLEFVTQILINKIHEDDKCQLPKPLRSSMHNFCEFTRQYHYIFMYRHYWYRFTPFDVAFSKIRELINNEITDNELCSMFNTLIIAAADSTENLKSVVEYYRNNYKNASESIKHSFITDFLSQTDFHKFDKDLWTLLEGIFMDDISKSEINEKLYSTESYNKICIDAIIIYYTLHKSKVPKDAENKFNFHTMKTYQVKLNKDEKDILFTYLYNTIIRKVNSHSLSINEEFVETTNLLNNALDLLIDWEKDLVNYPAVVNAIRHLTNVNEQNKFCMDFSYIYNKKKSWRRVLFNDALKIDPGEPVLINVLKHDPGLLERFEKTVDHVYLNNKIDLKQYHKKVKIYWSESLRKQLVQKYLAQLNNTEHNKAVVRALCILLTKDDLQNTLTKYAPVEEKIDWNDHSESTLSIRQNLAKLMYIARPQPSPDFILKYSKGDYYPYALPSLYSIFLNLNLANSQNHIHTLLDSKSSLQKHGVRLAFMKLTKEEVKNILGEVLRVNSNFSVRQIAFKLTFKLLCKEKDAEKSRAIWNIMDSFLDNITDKENDAIYELLLNVRDVPIPVAPLYYVKSYNILKNASESAYEKYKYSFENTFISYAREIMDQLKPEFVTQLITHFMDAEFFRMDYIDSKLEVLSSFLLCSENEESQMQKYNNVMVPFLQKCFEHWDIKTDNNHIVRLNVDKLIGILQTDIRHYVYDKKYVLPIRLFEEIYSDIVKNLDFPSNYILLTKWQITVAFVRHLSKHDGSDWEKVCEAVAPVFSRECKKYLLNHCEEHFSNIYVLFAKALEGCMKHLFSSIAVPGSVMLKTMLQNENHVQVFLCVLKLMQYMYVNTNSENRNKEIEELFKIISNHSSAEVQIHYYHCRNVHLKAISDSIFIDDLKRIHESKEGTISEVI